jgi:hypothetical protein
MGWLVKATPQPTYSREWPENHCLGSLADAKSVAPTGIRSRESRARSESLNHLRYPGPEKPKYSYKNTSHLQFLTKRVITRLYYMKIKNKYKYCHTIYVSAHQGHNQAFISIKMYYITDFDINVNYDVDLWSRTLKPFVKEWLLYSNE